MKKNEIALLILIVSISFAASFFAVRAVLGDASSKAVEVQTIEQVTADVTQPEARTFNETAINPTVEAEIGTPSNQQPLGNQ